MRRAWPRNEVNQRKVEHEEERDQVLKTSFKTLGPAFPEAITPRLSATRTDKVSFFPCCRAPATKGANNSLRNLCGALSRTPPSSYVK